ncbi:hypothetical protein [Arthrobacter oryzae]|uniref:hypothetical protein n=1 Tax=Arthrobacter oryzae TaxID=409290 RepID=UPI0030C94316
MSDMAGRKSPRSATDKVTAVPPPDKVSATEESSGAFLRAIGWAFTGDQDASLAESIKALRNDPGVLASAISLYESHTEDSTFRWSVLYVLALAGPEDAASWFERVALRSLPSPEEKSGPCETARDGEVLVGVMAVEGLGMLAESARGKAAIESLRNVVSQPTDPAIHSAAVLQLLKVDPGAADQLRLTLPETSQYLVDIVLEAEPSSVDERPSSLGLDAGESPAPPLRKR